MKITIPELALVVLIGPSGSGKSTFAREHFKATEVLSSDTCRGWVSDDENDQTVTKEAFEVLHFIAAKRLAAGKLTVIDATDVQSEARRLLVALAREYYCPAVGIVFDLPEHLCQERNRERPDRRSRPHDIRQQAMQMRRSLHRLREEGFHTSYMLSSPEEVQAVEIERQRLWNNLKHEHGPFDIIGDIHGCFDELLALLERLGYTITRNDTEHGPAFEVSHPEERKVILLGDLVDRGPKVPQVLRVAMDMVEAGRALVIPGNHDVKLLRKLKGRNVVVRHGLAESLVQLASESPAFIERAIRFIDALISHYVLDHGRLVVAHAGLKESMQGREVRAVREFALYGEVTGETDESGMPVRHNWAADYCGKAMVVYGHTPVPEPEWLNRTINIDTGCVFGGRLTALRYPEKEIVSVPALHTYSEPVRPLLLQKAQTPLLTAQQQHDNILDIADVADKRIISTQLRQNITLREENAIAAQEVMSRFAVNPRWLIYLPPTMSPAETSREEGLLEHPAEAFAYYRNEGITRVVCEEKHMGSRAIVIVCRDEDVARTCFGVVGEGSGLCYTRTGRPFFEDRKFTDEMLARLRQALDTAKFWAQFQTDWVCLDCELLPWSVNAQSLLLQQHAAVGTASHIALDSAVAVLEQVVERDPAAAPLLTTYRRRQQQVERYVNTYRRYCWPVHSVADLKLAPFHILATQGGTHLEKDHVWHMQTLAEICRTDQQFLLATPFIVVDVTSIESVEQGVRWWERVTQSGGEGIVVKPFDFIAQGRHGIVQPAIKCRGQEYLRIIYGPEYDLPKNLQRLRRRGLGTKRSLAMREFALGVEALERFAQGEPLHRVLECIFGVLALESEPVDPRL